MGWITLHGGEGEDESGGVHVYIGDGGRITKGPKGLLGGRLGHLKAHAKITRHPEGHEPAGARAHPHYAEHHSEMVKKHVYGRKGPGVGYDITIDDNPLRPLSPEETHQGLIEARSALKGTTAESASVAFEQHKRAVLQEHPDIAQHIASVQGQLDKLNTSNPADRVKSQNLIDTSQHEKWVDVEARARLSPTEQRAAGLHRIPSALQRFPKPEVPKVAPTSTPAAPASGPGQLSGQTELPGVPKSTATVVPTQSGFAGMPAAQPPEPKAAKQLPGQVGMFKPAMGGSTLVANTPPPKEPEPPQPPNGGTRRPAAVPGGNTILKARPYTIQREPQQMEPRAEVVLQAEASTPTHYAHPAADLPHLERMGALSGRIGHLRDIRSAIPLYGKANAMASANVRAEGVDQDLKYRDARKKLVAQQYDRLDEETKFALEPHLDASGKIDPSSAGHADADEVNLLLDTYHSQFAHKHEAYLDYLDRQSYHHDVMAPNAPTLSPLSYATAASHIRTHGTSTERHVAASERTYRRTAQDARFGFAIVRTMAERGNLQAQRVIATIDGTRPVSTPRGRL